MITKKMLACEESRLDRMNRFQFPNYAKKIGYAVALMAFLAGIINRRTVEVELLTQLSRIFMVAGLLIVSLSKEVIEDELIKTLRAYSFKLSFVISILMGLLMPVTNYLADLVIKQKSEGLIGEGEFFVLLMLVIMQLTYFNLLMRYHNEK